MRTLSLVGLVALAGTVVAAQSFQGLGYVDTPFIPGTKWRVHDGTRPQPPVVAPGPFVAAPPPAGAVVLFDGTSLAPWKKFEDPAPAGWRIEDGAMVVVGGAGTIESRESFGDVEMHIEWAAPAAVNGTGQGRGNSGVFLMSRYEVQILDSYENQTYPDGQAAAIYGQFPPRVNASRKPGEWQSFDIRFIAPRFRDATVVSPARLTVRHNGVLVHDDVALIGATKHRVVGTYEPHPDAAPIMLQDHGNPVRFRNIWVRRLAAGR